MSMKAAKWIFWLGTVSSLILFLILTVDTHGQFAALTNADRLDETAVSGRRAFQRHNCNDCHTIQGFGGYYAPDLTRVHIRLGSDAIKRRLAQPEVVFADSYRKTPQQHPSPREIDEIAAYLAWVDGIQNHDWPPHDSTVRWKRSMERTLASATLSPAAALVEQDGCLASHALGDRGEKKEPHLEHIGMTRDAAWIGQYLADPQVFAPGSKMPGCGHLSAGQRQMVGEFITALAAARGRGALTYRTQRIAYPYFVEALLLFGLQVLLGLWLTTQYFVTMPQGGVDTFTFSIARAMHTNLLVLWLLLGFMGSTFYLVPEETGPELADRGWQSASSCC
jgi:nitric oxide reductase subunit C